MENTPSEIIQDLKLAVHEIYEEIVQSNDWDNLSWLESEADAFMTIKREKSDFKRRIDKANRSRIASYTDLASGKTVNLIEPRQENGVFAIYMQLSCIKPDLFPFAIVDYDTHFGIDVIAKSMDSIPIKTSRLFYVEFKNYLTKSFKHSSHKTTSSPNHSPPTFKLPFSLSTGTRKAGLFFVCLPHLSHNFIYIIPSLSKNLFSSL